MCDESTDEQNTDVRAEIKIQEKEQRRLRSRGSEVKLLRSKILILIS